MVNDLSVVGFEYKGDLSLFVGRRSAGMMGRYLYVGSMVLK